MPMRVDAANHHAVLLDEPKAGSGLACPGNDTFIST